MTEDSDLCHEWDKGINLITCFPSLRQFYFLFLFRAVCISTFKSFALARYTHLSAFTHGPGLVTSELVSSL